MVSSIIRTAGLRKSYAVGTDEVTVLKGVSFDVLAGEFVSIMGQSGSGKSTLLNILGCLDFPTEGTYTLNGTEVALLSDSQRADLRNRQIGFVFQNFNLLPRLSIAANVELPLIYGNVPRKRRRELVEQQLQRLGIWHRRGHKPNEISGGEKQRCAIARALVKKPALILADEPTGNLDSATTNEIMMLFRELHEEGNTIVIITHEDSVARRCSRTVRLVDGTIVAA